jgi:hypothetical protein
LVLKAAIWPAFDSDPGWVYREIDA